ncbi:MAG TPA: type II toxin-antitoxin system VapC family toxin [Terriglobia bacterium]|nr:type II toxin-antitoxin system VapC family toxin [Terriglobia bacterium]
MKFWDSSAVIPLLVPEVMSGSIQKLFQRDPVIVAWWATELECTSAIARRQRGGHLREDLAAEAFNRLSALRAGWHEVEPSEEIRESARRLLRVHDLRTADALQLAAAFFVAEARPSTLEFISLDERLLTAARREGFSTMKPPL